MLQTWRQQSVRLVLAAVAIASLGACDREPEKQRAAQLVERHQAQAKAKLKADAPITPRALQVGNHELLVIEVPSVEFGSFVSSQRCYVWRDAEFRVATMSCPHEAAIGSTDADESSARDPDADRR
jgi:hypothetical protein